ncbi:MAG TPA: DUF255 domain-containing protein [Fimbriimonas sp.]
MPNRLANEASPYLLQHKDNPVDWYPWGPEAFERARSEDRPIFLSVGYSSCHWCHVMEHESFMDEKIARLLNDHFVSVKVDREERPDVDEAYMTAVQLSSGRGGWPMSVFLTPDRKPFFAGTYFPKDDRGQASGFGTILNQIALLWRTKREEVLRSGESFASALKETLGQRPPGTFDTLSQKLIDDAVRAQAGSFDQQHGGFGQAPKFPPHSAVEFLLNYAVSPGAEQQLREAALAMACSTLEAMALGGIHDHVGGGFHRYSTDERWLLPHFEKMLYDNALLLRNYALAAGLVVEIDPRLSSLFLDTVQGIVGWALREMVSSEGLFFSALDADSEGEEGRFYVWQADEIRRVLADPEPLLAAYRVEDQGNFRDEATGALTGANVLHLAEDAQGGFQEQLEALRFAREQRVRPGVDYKALVGWNGLMIGALAEAGAVEPAIRAARSILGFERAHGRLPHLVTNSTPSGEGFLDDYAYLADGLSRLSSFLGFLEESGDRNHPEPSDFWREEAKRLAGEMVRLFWDEQNGGFFATSDRHEVLFGRTKPVFDSPTPSGNAVAALVLQALGDTDRAERTIEAVLGWMQRAPQATEALHLAAMPLAAAVPSDEPKPTAAPSEVQVSFGPKEAKAGADGVSEFEVRIGIPEGLHLNGPNPPARWLVPTLVAVAGVPAQVRYPETRDDHYYGEVAIPFRVTLPPGAKDAEFEVKVGYQACTESECLLAQERTFTGVVYR